MVHPESTMGERAVAAAFTLIKPAKILSKLQLDKARKVIKQGDKSPLSASGKTKGTGNLDKTYKRPSGYRKGVRDEVWKKAKDTDGNVRDPLTGTHMNKDEPWDMGHKPGYEFRKHQQSAMERDISRKRFLDEHNKTDHYYPGFPFSNRSHKGEDLTDDYFGD